MVVLDASSPVNVWKQRKVKASVSKISIPLLPGMGLICVEIACIP